MDKKSHTTSRPIVDFSIAAVAFISLAISGIGLAWVVGSLGISASAATQIVTAIEIGGAALALVMAIFGGGIIGAIAATVRYHIKKKGKKMAIA